MITLEEMVQAAPELAGLTEKELIELREALYVIAERSLDEYLANRE